MQATVPAVKVVSQLVSVESVYLTALESDGAVPPLTMLVYPENPAVPV